MENETSEPTNFIRQIIDEDLKNGKNEGKLVTRFPPEPNGYLHIGHAKSICLNFGIVKKYDAICHLRFDDTNPEKEEEEYVKSIIDDIKWLGFDWGEKLFHASDYFEKLYQFAIELINKGKAFVCELNAEEMRLYRGSLKDPGKNSPHRDRTIEENLDLFTRMRSGEFENGKYSLRAKIDMSHPNINMRDPVLYRIKKITHQRTGNAWPIYPMYDFTHPLSDMMEGITHSLCTLEFEDHRPLYDWILETLETPCHPRQIEFSRLNLEYTIMSKRKLLELVEEKHVEGWDDPRMPTVSGMRKRGYTPNSIRNFCEQIGITKKESSISMSTLESAVRDDLGPLTPRVFAVLDPIKVTITNYPEGKIEEIGCDYHPQDPTFGNRHIPFSNEIYIEKDDFIEVAPNRKWFRLSLGKSVRLKYAYVITCDEVIKNGAGEIIELKCSYNKETFGGVTPEGMKKVKGIINWVSKKEAIDVEVRLYDRLFSVPNPGSDKDRDYHQDLNPDSLKVITSKVEPSLSTSKPGQKFQFERQGYFIVDHLDDQNIPVFNRIITLKDTWFKKDQ